MSADGEEMKALVIDDYADKMRKAIAHLQSEFAAVRTGRASSGLVEKIRVDAYGSDVPLQQLAGFGVPEPRVLTISPYDKGTIKAIEKAIQQSDLGVNPSNDGQIIRLVFPELTEERRKDLVKQIHKRMEEARVEIRNLRRDAADAFKKEEHDGTIGTDDVRREMEHLQKITDKHVGDVDRVGATKEQEILEV